MGDRLQDNTPEHKKLKNARIESTHPGDDGKCTEELDNTGIFGSKKTAAQSDRTDGVFFADCLIVIWFYI